MKRKRKVLNYTLLELLIAGSILVFFTGVLITFFHKGIKLCRYFSENAYSNQQILTIKKKWRKFVHQSDLDFISTSVNGKTFASAERSVVFKDGQINFKDIGKTESYRLAKNMDVKFDMDYNTEIPLAIMNISFKPRFNAEKEEIIRIVACPGVK